MSFFPPRDIFGTCRIRAHYSYQVLPELPDVKHTDGTEKEPLDCPLYYSSDILGSGTQWFPSDAGEHLSKSFPCYCKIYLYLFERQLHRVGRESESKRQIFNLLIHSPLSQVPAKGQDWSRPKLFPVSAQAQAFGASSTFFPGVLAERWIRSKAAGTRTSIYM